jgi:hypothetical protein
MVRYISNSPRPEFLCKRLDAIYQLHASVVFLLKIVSGSAFAIRLSWQNLHD